MQQIPCGWHNTLATLALGPGSVIDLDIFSREFKMVESYMGPGYLKDRLVIDPNVAVISKDHVEAELSLKSGIGSTGKGVGAATADRVMRHCETADQIDWLTPYIELVPDRLRLEHERGAAIIVESTQGFGLSLTRSNLYPFTTSRDITPAAVLNEAGIPHNWPTEVIAVFRTFPIRVAGNSGPLAQETNFPELEEESGGYIKEERTTVTNNVRRIGRWDPDLAKTACKHLQPDSVYLSFVDYVMPEVAMRSRLLPSELDRIADFQDDLDAPIRWVGTGFGSIIELDEALLKYVQRIKE